MKPRAEFSSAFPELERHLAPYAAHAARTRGREHAEPGVASRTEFQRDRDRIIHCAAFRRLEYKTQVFVNHEGDLFRTRLTHSLEVAQIARSIARGLRLNEDLVEAIALAHDLGHAPFGHAGQEALNGCMKQHGGFEHNLQSLLVVDRLEARYGGFDGLNLTFETREGILKHCARRPAAALGELGRRFLEGRQPSLEAQLVNLADEIAYSHHDLDDGLRAGLLTLAQLEGVSLWAAHRRAAETAFPGIDERRLAHETIRRMIDAMVNDLIHSTRAAIERVAPHSIDDVRASAPLVGFSAPMRDEARALKRFLFGNLYRHETVMRMADRGRGIIRDVFGALTDDPRLLPLRYQALDPAMQPRWIAHYIAGMTDRYAIQQHRRLFAARPV